ncbi:hypothetical protein B4U84_26350 [Westiellopsis prolifica IICB1]|nr:hypothetical protein B4U84_26350 [Westiellopsis prolifica IICB1]
MKKAKGSPDEKFFTAKHESGLFPYTPHPYTHFQVRRDASLVGASTHHQFSWHQIKDYGGGLKPLVHSIKMESRKVEG